MMNEELRQHRIAWIPWVLAVVALLGINALSRDDSRVRLNETDDGVGISFAAKDLGTIGRVSYPLVFGPPAPLTETVCHDTGSKFVKLEAGKDFDPAGLRHGAARGRAPPVDA
jgi:hypothetical protein